MSKQKTAPERRLKESDGVDHINISLTGKTKLGQMLSFGYQLPFVHPYFGPFNCMDGFWYYIKTAERPDQMRYVSAAKARALAHKLTPAQVNNFEEIIVAANWHKIVQNQELYNEFIKSELPFDYYYLYGPAQLEVRPRIHAWVVDGFEDLRRLMKSGKDLKEPDYTHVVKSTGDKGS